MPGRDIRYAILLDLRAAGQAAAKSVERSLTRIADKTRNLSRVSQRMLLGLAGAVGAVAWAAAEQERADIALASALRQAGDASEETFKAMQDLAGEIQNVTIYGDEQVQSLAAQALNLGITTDRLEEAVKGAIGLSKALNLDLNTALRYTALALQGEYSMLQRHSAALRAAGTEAEKAAIVHDMMRKGFQQAKDEAAGLWGSVLRLKNRLGDLVQALGESLLGVGGLAKSVQRLEVNLRKVIARIGELTDEQKQWIITGLKATAVTLAVLAVVSPLMRALAGLAAAFRGLTSPAGIVVGSLTAIAASAAVVAEAGKALQWMQQGITEVALALTKLAVDVLQPVVKAIIDGIMQLVRIHDALDPFVKLAPKIEDAMAAPVRGLESARDSIKKWAEDTRAETRKSVANLDAAIESLWQGFQDREAERRRRALEGGREKGPPAFDLDRLKKQFGEIEGLVEGAGEGLADRLRDAGRDAAGALDEALAGMEAAAGAGAARAAAPTRAERLRGVVEQKLGVAQLLARHGYREKAAAKYAEARQFYADFLEFQRLVVSMEEAERKAIEEVRRQAEANMRGLKRLATARAI